MPGFTSYDDLITQITVNGFEDNSNFMKVGGTMQAGGATWYSMYLLAGAPGTGTSVAGAVTSTTANSQNGAIVFPNVSTQQRYMLTFGAVASLACTIMVYDRLAVGTSISLATTGSKSVSTAALPRYSGTDAAGVECWLEITTATTTTAPVVHLLSYTDQAGNTGSVGTNLTFPAAATVLNSLIGPLPLAAGDQGIQAVSTINVDTAAAAGAANPVLLRPLAYLPLLAGTWNERDMVLQLTSLPRLFDQASLCFAVLPAAATALTVWGQIRTAYE
jgi:hypothetical protein